jgi:hypothetical protein
MVLGKKVQKFDKKYFCGLLLLTFGLSWLSQLLISLVISSNLIEFILIPSLTILSRSKHQVSKIIVDTLTGQSIRILIPVILLFSILGVMGGEYNPAYVYADLRANSILIFFYLIFTNKNWEPSQKEDFLIHCLILISLFDILALALRPYMGQDKTKQTISIIAPAILSIYYLRKNTFTLSFLFCIIMSYEAVVCFFRNYYLIAIVTYSMMVYATFINLKSNKKTSERIKSLSFILCILISALYSAPVIYQYWMSDDSKMIHSINRTEEFIQNSGTEKERISSLSVILSSPEIFIIPHGIGWRNFHQKISKDFASVDIISSMDSCIFYLSYHYGIIIFALVVSYMMFIIVKSFIKKEKNSDIFTKAIRFGFLILFFASFFTQGVMFTILQASFVYACLYSIIVKPI